MLAVWMLQVSQSPLWFPSWAHQSYSLTAPPTPGRSAQWVSQNCCKKIYIYVSPASHYSRVEMVSFFTFSEGMDQKGKNYPGGLCWWALSCRPPNSSPLATGAGCCAQWWCNRTRAGTSCQQTGEIALSCCTCMFIKLCNWMMDVSGAVPGNGCKHVGDSRQTDPQRVELAHHDTLQIQTLKVRQPCRQRKNFETILNLTIPHI